MESKKPMKIYQRGRAKNKGGAKDLCPTITGTAFEQNHFVVSDIARSTDTPPQSTGDISPSIETTETQLNLIPESSPTSTFLSVDSRARLLALLENAPDSRTFEELSFLKSLGFSNTSDPDIFYSKTYQAYLVMKAEKLSSPLLRFSPTLGIESHGRFLILRTTDYRSTEKESSLPDVLEETTDPKYFLSQKALDWLKKRATDSDGRRGRTSSAVRAGMRGLPGSGETYIGYPNEEYSTAIDASYHKGPDAHDQRTILLEVSNTVTSSAYFTDGRRERINGKPSKEPTPEWKRRIRRMTPVECERLQGFPDHYTQAGISEGGIVILISDTQRYKCLGNAVSTNVIARIVSGWKELIQ